MKTILAVVALLVLAASSMTAQQPARPDALLDHLTGNWVLQGIIAGQKTTHDIESAWVLNHEYLRIHETSREKNAQGQPTYEAIITVEWDEVAKEYRCLWLDSTGGGGLAVPAAKGKRGDDQIEFLFQDKDGGVHTTFAYSKTEDSWSWLIDNEDGGKLKPFARVKLTRKL